MFSKEESKQVKQLFWTSFGKSFPRKWIKYNTKIKDFSFKFHFNNETAFVSLDIEGTLENRIKYWEKLESLQNILKTEFLPNVVFEEDYVLENGKELSRIYLPFNKKVNIHNKNHWQEVMLFFNVNMSLFERFFNEYQDFIKA